MINERELWQQIFLDVRKHGKIVAPRDKEIIEVENYHYELPPYIRFCTLTPRELKLDYIRAETNWMLRGDPYDLSISKHSNIWRNIVVDGKLNSNYGFAWYTKFGFDFVVKQLIADKDSRRASTVIIEREHLDLKQKDVPCTAYVNFRIREDKLNMSVHMRSQDAIYGLGNDAPAFSFLQEMVFVSLRDLAYPDLQMGTYHHTADSFHVYERHYEMLDYLTHPNVIFHHQEFPKIKNAKEVDFLLSRNIGRQSLTAGPAIGHEDFKFSKWLETGLIEIF